MKKIILTLMTLGYILGSSAVYANIANEHITTMFHKTLAEKQTERIGKIHFLFEELGVIAKGFFAYAYVSVGLIRNLFNCKE